MELGSQGDARGIRRARNQALFRVVNEKLKDFNEAFEGMVDSHEIVCECADVSCLEAVELGSAAYAEVRAHSRRFVVLRGHIYPEVECVVGEFDGYMIVEKMGAAGEFAEAAAVGSG